jgi:hypothetical protein
VEPRDCLEAVCCGLDLEADRTQEGEEEATAVLLVVDDEKPAGRLVGGETKRAGRSDRARACGLAGDCAEAEGDGEDAAVAFDAANGDVAFHHAGELAADG